MSHSNDKSDLECAIDPQQYDTGNPNWEQEGAADNPFRAHYFHYYLRKYLDCHDKTVIDIGCGTGSLTPLLRSLNAKRMVGIEPSVQNVTSARTHYPDMEVINSTLDGVIVEGKFDVAVCVMVFEHIEDTKSAFAKIHTFLRPNGTLYLIVANRDYYLAPRFGYDIRATEVGDDTTVVRITRPTGTICDLVRPVGKYITDAKSANFVAQEPIPLLPTAELIKSLPKYALYKETPISYLLILNAVP